MRSLIFGLAVLATQSGVALADNSPPSVPTGVTASASGNDVRVAWTAASDNVRVAGYNIYRDGSYRTTVFDTAWTDYGAGNGHRYQVVAFDDARNYTTMSAEAVSDGGNGTAALRSADVPGVPGTPSASVQADGSVRLSWSGASGNVRGYNVYRDGGYLTTVFATQWTDTGVASGREHRYSIVAFSSDGRFSGTSGEVVARSGSAAGVTRAFLDDGQNVDRGGAPDGYRLVFSDEFRDYSIDGGKWSTRYRWGPNWIINNERQYYVDIQNDPGFGQNPFSFDGEHLTISATRTPDALRGRANSQPWLSGAMTTFGKFTMTYGYVEMRAKLPRGPGLWPAFWLLHEGNDEKRPEIDVVEMLGRDPNTIYQTYHWYENYNLRSTPSYEVRQADYSADFHTYGMLWEPGRIVWYVDGRETNRFENGNVSYENMYLLVNLAVGGSWGGEPDDSTASPSRLTIDYIRAYRR